jgi:hypothetical protein
MNNIFFVLGFNNWGKSTIIRSLFPNVFRFDPRMPRSLIHHPDVSLFVQQASNDDLGIVDFLRTLNNLTRNASANGTADVLTAICPSMEPNNQFANVFADPTVQSFKNVHLIFLEYKWEGHAKLLIQEVKNTLTGAGVEWASEIILSDRISTDDESAWNMKIHNLSDYIAEHIQ